MARKSPQPQQQTLSVRIDDALRRRLERARQLEASKTGEPVSTSEIAKQFLEAARDDRLEVVDLQPIVARRLEELLRDLGGGDRLPGLGGLKLAGTLQPSAEGIVDPHRQGL